MDSAKFALLVQFIVVTVALTPTAHAQKSLVNTGGQCTSQGAWTTQALSQTEAIFETVQNLKNDPDCKVIVDALVSVDVSSTKSDAATDSGSGSTFETLPKELDSLRAVLDEQKNNRSLISRLTPVLVKATLDMATNTLGILGPVGAEDTKPIRERINRTADTGISILTKLMSAMPNAKQCLDRNPNEALSLLSGITKLAAAFASSGNSVGSGFANLLANYVNFLREMEYAGFLKKLNQEKFWAEMSCLIETTQMAYCNVRDGFKLLEYQADSLKIEGKINDPKSAKEQIDTPLEGYFLLLREGPTISAWLQRVQFGVQPKLMTDAQFKNETWQTSTSLMQDLNRIQGIYNENLLIYQGLQNVEQKQQNVRVLIHKLTETMSAGSGGPIVNFFIQAVPAEKLPFFLIGRDKIPDEVLGKVAGGVPMDPFKYLLNAANVPEFVNPDRLMAKILERLGSLGDLALREGSKYFARRMSVDLVNLTDESLTDSAITVHQSMYNIRNYLARLYARLGKTGQSADQQVRLSMLDTISRIDKVLQRFSVLNEKAKSFSAKVNGASSRFNDQYSIKNLSGLSDADRETMREAFTDLIQTAYIEFNILLQRDSFITQRLNTYVRYDFFNRVRNKEDMSPYVQYLLISAGKSVLSRMQEFMQFNVAELEADLSLAQRINRTNIDQIEELFQRNMWSYINDTAKVSGNTYANSENLNPFNKLWETALAVIIPQLTFERFTKMPAQDTDGNRDLLLAKLCTQTLGFRNWRFFSKICKDLVLESNLTASAAAELPLKVDYNEMVAQKDMGFSDSLRMKWNSDYYPENKRYMHTCTLRDYFRNNQVYWMTLQFNDDSAKRE